MTTEFDKQDELWGGSRVPGEFFCGCAIPGGGGGLKPGGGGGKLIPVQTDESRGQSLECLCK